MYIYNDTRYQALYCPDDIELTIDNARGVLGFNFDTYLYVLIEHIEQYGQHFLYMSHTPELYTLILRLHVLENAVLKIGNSTLYH